MEKREVMERTIEYVKNQLENAEGGHDWFHIERVWRHSRLIAELENADLFITELGALLHDIADSKFHGGDEMLGPRVAAGFLNSLGVDHEIIEQVITIIREISFKGGNFNSREKSIELQVVQDADRLDALGAIGIARAFNYGGFKNRKLYDPSVPPNLAMDKEAYKNSSAPTINHFYEKLFLLKDLMNTKTGKEMANERHAFMEKYIDQFYKEWNASP